MDSSGHWHRGGDLAKELALAQGEARDPSNRRPRFVLELEIGSTVEVTRGADKLLAVFEGAEKNKVSLAPIHEAGKPMPYLELAERVMLSDGKGTSVPAQVWDNRNGALILRTLPTH